MTAVTIRRLAFAGFVIVAAAFSAWLGWMLAGLPQ